jgi:hypothetical protein
MVFNQLVVEVVELDLHHKQEQVVVVPESSSSHILHK